MSDVLQGELLLPSPLGEEDVPLVPVRMINEWVYCPRLAYLMWIEAEWADTADTEDGRRVHRRADRPSGSLPQPGDAVVEEEPAPFRCRSVTLSSTRLGMVGKMDVVEGEGRHAVPVELKRGARPHVAQGAHDPERVQLCAQALLLEEAGFEVAEGFIWFAASRERVPVLFDSELREKTLRAAADLRLTAATGRRPPPLENSPKCPRCAVAGICLPDEVNFFRDGALPRPLNPADDPALPLHVQAQGACLRKKGETLVVEADEEKTDVPLIDVSSVSLYGRVSLTTPALHELMRREIPVAWHSTGGWLMGHTVGTGTRNVTIRAAQFRVADDPPRSLCIAAGLVAAKIRNQRTILRRNWKGGAEDPALADVMDRLKQLAAKAPHAGASANLLGIEGEAAALYFRHFPKLIVPSKSETVTFDFEGRNRRPPADPVNALLSFSYALAVRLFVSALVSAGFDPYQGFYHRPRHGRPALALDMMEPFRPLLCDSTVLMVINNGEVGPSDFVTLGRSCSLTPSGRRSLVAAWERRLDQETTHPIFGYRLTTRRLIDVQCRLLARHIAGEIPEMPHYVPR
ncbi:CRISPR-associated endonuclease Cas4/Cas1 (plasmid) [Cereibacter azotoformans]|uniref:CRISPR-associated endonuclease Cas1 n=1 Tax=Cereibacter azotoformans TaxID=43057 RepID=A0A2T5JPZ4_9RHOB|nr:CRISPR-associated endonuclease Cas4/Cas1 [Cereibacter azotoformans]AXQ96311.1 CRISPR-associated endonuclease Cas4/Cas1 [Cereibacter sphaeroides]MBO4170810.1 CRISPR-associated endonuclease Cas4/Cas1 [Cereibacter azotoformans]PTR09909.1 CRISPR-associated exonuclease Cas4/CRISPR-associated protein Cas1 [Cereibacter azotoformans]UIJ33310.1 CRISPR-associated endonuclease Cas4/Cas1 [Cereibacter azotoformans]